MVEDKMQTYVSILSGVTGASVTPDKRIPRKKRNMKSPVMSPPRKYPIPNQDINRFTTKNIKVLHHIYQNILLDINNYLIMHMIQTVQNIIIMILQILHVMRKKIL